MNHQITRKTVVLATPPTAEPLPRGVLLVNVEPTLAAHIRSTLKEQGRASAVLFAPTITVAEWVWLKRDIGVVIASEYLPDGTVTDLRRSIARSGLPIDMVVLGQGQGLGEVVSRMQRQERRAAQAAPFADSHVVKNIKVLGADLRNDLNNPLQEIVAMVFVAKASEGVSLGAEALTCIEEAARRMNEVVNNLESRIQGTLGV